MQKTSKVIEISEYSLFPDKIYIPENKYRDFKTKFIDTRYFKLTTEPVEDNGIKSFTLKTKYYIGIVKFPNNQNYIIMPKIFGARFIEMLKIVDPKKFKIIDLLQGITKDLDFFEILINRFLISTERLLSSFIRKSYQAKIEKLKIVKGKLKINETLRNNEFFFGNVVCHYDNFTVDNFDNQLIKLTLFKLKYIANSKHQARIIRLLSELKEVSLREFNHNDLRNIRYNRLNSHYKIVHTYCIMILENFSFSLQFGKYKSFCMLLNSWDVYEQFLRKLMENYLKKYVSKSITVTKNLRGFKSWDKNKNIPDIIIKENNRILLLCDAKYKLKHKSSDYHQAGNYLRNLMKLKNLENLEIKVENRKIILIYPLNENNKMIFKDLEKDDEQKQGRIYGHSIDLSRIDDKNYLKKWVLDIANEFNLK